MTISSYYIYVGVLTLFIIVAVFIIRDKYETIKILREILRDKNKLLEMEKYKREYLLKMFYSIQYENGLIKKLVDKNVLENNKMLRDYNEKFKKDFYKTYQLGQHVYDKKFGNGIIVNMYYFPNGDDGNHNDYILVYFLDKSTATIFSKYYYKNGKFFNKDKKPRLLIVNGIITGK